MRELYVSAAKMTVYWCIAYALVLVSLKVIRPWLFPDGLSGLAFLITYCGLIAFSVLWFAKAFGPIGIELLSRIDEKEQKEHKQN